MTGSREAYNQAMKEGRALAWAMNWQAAAEQYRRALHEAPDDLVARNSLAVTLYRAANWAEALREYERVSQLNPGDVVALARIAELRQRVGDAKGAAQAYVILGKRHFEQRDREKALEAWAKVLECFSTDRDALEILSNAAAEAGETAFRAEVDARRATLVAQQDVSEVEEETVDEAAAEEPAAGTDAQPGSFDGELGQNGSAGHDSSDGLAIAGELAADWGLVNPRELAALGEHRFNAMVGGLRLGKEYAKQGKFRSAEDEYLRLVSIAPECLLPQEGLAEVYTWEERDFEAQEKYLSLAELYELRSDYGRAATMCRKLADLGSRDLQHRVRAASLLLRVGLDTEAQAELLLIGEGYLARGQIDAGLDALQQAIAVDPSCAEAHVKLGCALEAQGRYEEAAESFRRALELNPADAATTCALSAQLAAMGDWNGLWRVFGSVTDLASGDPEVRATSLARYLEIAGRLEQAPDLEYCAGVLLRIDGRPDEARGHLEAAATGGGLRAILSNLYLGEDAFSAGNLDQASGYLSRGLNLCVSASKEGPDAELESLELRYNRLLADTFSAKEDWRQAEVALREVKRLDPGDDTTHTRLAEIYFRQGELAAAVEEFSQLADLFLKTGQDDRAVIACQAALQLHPYNFEARRKLAEVYVHMEAWDNALSELGTLADRQFECGLGDEGYGTLREMLELARSRNTAMAISIRERMAKLRPNDVEVRRELVEAYLKAGRSSQALDEARDLARMLLKLGHVGEAVAALRRVVSLSPWDVQALGQLGDALCLLGQMDEAATVYERLLAVEPDSIQAKSALAAIRQRG